MPLTNKRSPEQWAALVAEVQARSAKRKTARRSKVAKQAWDRLVAARTAAIRKGRRQLRDRLAAVRAMEKRFWEAEAEAEVERRIRLVRLRTAVSSPTELQTNQ
jgi:hypothetical protein